LKHSTSNATSNALQTTFEVIESVPSMDVIGANKPKLRKEKAYKLRKQTKHWIAWYKSRRLTRYNRCRVLPLMFNKRHLDELVIVLDGR